MINRPHYVRESADVEEKEIRQYAEEFIDYYFYKKNLSVLMSMMHPDICWSHYGQRIVRGIDNVRKMLNAKEDIFSLDFCNIQFLDVKISNQDSTVEYKAELQICKGEMQKTIIIFGSLTFVLEGQDILLYEVTFSLFQSGKQIIDYVFKENNEKENNCFQLMQSKNANHFQQIHNDLEVLTNNVPGGIFKCLDNDELTILYMSEGFLSMFGYTRDEIKERFHNSFKEMIAPEDRISTSQEVKRQMKLGKTKRIEYRIIHHDGHYVWVLDKGQLIEEHTGGYPCFYCIMIDVTQEKKVEEELRLSLERYNIIMDQTNDVIFEWDILKKQIRFSKNWKTIFGGRVLELEKSCYEDDEFKKCFYPKDINKLEHILNEIGHGKRYIEEEIRLMDKEHHCHWCRLRLTVQFDKHEVPLRIIGILVDIDEEKKRSQYLLHKAQQDALTGIYNKMTVQNLIKDYLLEMNTHEVCALMIIDIDNFKEINDFQGHLFGDAILSDIARRMKNSFPYTDIIGRIGGDEFIIFFKNVQDLEDVKKKAQTMINEMHLLENSHRGELHISCSIGVSIAPRDGMEFTELFQKADWALYQAKNAGKKQFVIYDQSITHEYLINRKQVSLINEKIDSNDNNRISGGQIAEYVFRVLYNSSDVKNAVTSILEIVGLQFDVSRVYIFENVDYDQYCCNTFEWCNQGVEPQIDVLSHVSYERDLGGNYLDNFNENGIFYCSDIKSLPKLQYEILAPQGIKSVLQCAIKDNGVFKGYVGFDECRQNRYWTQEQIDVLVFISEILSVFLLKSRAETNLKQESQSLLSVLNNQSHCIYVIDPRTFQILFMNKRTKELCKKEEIGKPCYEIFMKRQSPCDFCPAVRLNGECDHYKQEVYNPYFHCRLNIDASYVSWQGQEAIMLSCYNITQYQK